MFAQYLKYKILGNTIQQYLLFLGYLVASILISIIVYWLFKKVFKALTKRTSSKLDDIFVEKARSPLIGVIIILGLYRAFQKLNLSDNSVYWLDNTAEISIALLFAWFLIRFADKISDFYSKAASNQPVQRHIVPLSNLVFKTLLIIVTMIYIVSTLGYNVTSLLASLGIGGLAVALAAQELLKNIIGGIVIMIDQPFKIGDWIIVQDYRGTVEEIGLRSIRIRTPEYDYISIPNQVVTESSIANLTKFPVTRIIFNLQLDHNTTSEIIDELKKVVKNASEQIESIVSGSCEVTFTTFNHYSLDLYVAFAFRGNTPSEERKVKDAINIPIKKYLESKNIKLAVANVVSVSS